MVDVLHHRRPLPIVEQAQERSERTATSPIFHEATIYLQTRSDVLAGSILLLQILCFEKHQVMKTILAGS